MFLAAQIEAVVNLFGQSAGHLLLSILLILLAWCIFSYLHLRRIPGPLLASISNLPRLFWVVSRRAHLQHIALHKKYGKLVRMGPNMVSVADPAAIPIIYGFGQKFIKETKQSDFYHVILPVSQGKIIQTVFATQDEETHRQLKRPIAAIYSMSNLVSFESYVDSTMRTFFNEIDNRFMHPEKICDFDVWLQYFAFDVIGEITFSQRLGFLERGEDVDGIMASIWHNFERTSWVGQMPSLDYIWHKNPIRLRLQADSVTSPIVAFALARAQERQGSGKVADGSKEMNNRDFLSRFLEVLEKDPTIPRWALTAWTTSNVLAGSDTTAITLRTIFFNLLKHPETLQKLLEELKIARKEGRLSDLVSWKQSRDLPYLDACIKEAGRLHPPFGLQLERIVPPEGVTISGEFFEAGTVVGINAWVVHRDVETFGEDASSWRPDRWLGDPSSVSKMEHALLTFGAGHRVCIGKNISLLEMYKLVPTMIQRYNIELVDQKQELHVENRWFVAQTNFPVRFKRRDI